MAKHINEVSVKQPVLGGVPVDIPFIVDVLDAWMLKKDATRD